jgi:hypothetical protein
MPDTVAWSMVRRVVLISEGLEDVAVMLTTTIDHQGTGTYGGT